VPTAEQVEDLWGSDQDAVVEMVQRLYIIEHATPKLGIPGLHIIDTGDGKVIIGYEGTMNIEIGEDPVLLSYEVELDPRAITVAISPTNEGLTAWVYIAVGIGLCAAWVVMGAPSTR